MSNNTAASEDGNRKVTAYDIYMKKAVIGGGVKIKSDKNLLLNGGRGRRLD